jgi:hypothetical protein
VGGGCPPIETEMGWLLIYHGVHDTVNGYVYTACACLLDLDNPNKEIARLPYPLFGPELEWELKGVVNNVCFPTGTWIELPVSVTLSPRFSPSVVVIQIARALFSPIKYCTSAIITSPESSLTTFKAL